MTPEEPKPESNEPQVPVEPTTPSPPEPPKLPLGKRVTEPEEVEVKEKVNSSDDTIRTWYRENTAGTRNRELAGAIVALILFGLIPLGCSGLFWVVCGRGLGL